MQYLESLIDDLYFLDCFKDICKALNTSLSILTIDSPSEVKRYTSYLAADGGELLFDEALIRRIMSCRIDFSREAVAKVKVFQ